MSRIKRKISVVYTSGCGATAAEYILIAALLGLLVILLRPVLINSASSLYLKNNKTMNTINSGPYVSGGQSQAGNLTNNGVPEP